VFLKFVVANMKKDSDFKNNNKKRGLMRVRCEYWCV